MRTLTAIFGFLFLLCLLALAGVLIWGAASSAPKSLYIAIFFGFFFIAVPLSLFGALTLISGLAAFSDSLRQSEGTRRTSETNTLGDRIYGIGVLFAALGGATILVWKVAAMNFDFSPANVIAICFSAILATLPGMALMLIGAAMTRWGPRNGGQTTTS